MQPLDRLPPPPGRRPSPPRPFGRSGAWAALHPIVFAAVVWLATIVVLPVAMWIGGSRRSYTDYLVASAGLGALFGTQAFFRVRPVPGDRLAPALIAVAGVSWIAGLLLGADLFIGGILIAAFVVAAYAGNRSALAMRERSARARGTVVTPHQD